MWKSFNDQYIISDKGEVKNLKTNHLLKGELNSKGYKRVSIKGNRYFVHRLVALLFIDNPNNLPQVNHINGNKLDNFVENLEWCTNQYNNTHSYKNGRTSGRTKLSKKNVMFIKSSIDNKTLTCKKLAEMFNVKLSTIYAIKQGLNSKRLNF